MAMPTLRIISECFIQPLHALEESKQPFYLTFWDLLFIHPKFHIQRGLLFAKPPKPEEASHDQDFMKTLLDRLKHSLSVALVHFFPFAGRLKTIKNQNPVSYSFYVDCNDSPGAKFIYATIGMSMSDILSLSDGTSDFVGQSFFDTDRVVNDLNTMSLLTVRVTELVDGVFILCGITHSTVDGNSFWHFFNMWSEIFQAQGYNTSIISISRPPILKRSFPNELPSVPVVDDFIKVIPPTPSLRVRRIHFSAQVLAKLKAKANEECNTGEISTFQSLSAFIWRSITRARHLPPSEKTVCMLPIDARSKSNPPLSQDYFGNRADMIIEVTTARQLLEHGLGWSAWKLHQAVVNFSVKALRSSRDLDRVYPPNSVIVNGSFRFNIFGNEFGMGKPVEYYIDRYKFNGNVFAHSGKEERSIDLEVCLPHNTMCDLESDKEFMEAFS
ncbi:hypothetical protein FNV43_RR26609 [Rhamnella rubrinervis]|uniref:Uncharacterized protein n=1 Tax=Rhamnella rubrinervis TaxID=2594499 RepID=A0A8K0DMW3_9ROSA|nr:hypothetical protein FNV43_RR26609 [Rhamnella rubrinervis]